MLLLYLIYLSTHNDNNLYRSTWSRVCASLGPIGRHALPSFVCPLLPPDRYSTAIIIRSYNIISTRVFITVFIYLSMTVLYDCQNIFLLIFRHTCTTANIPTIIIFCMMLYNIIADIL